MSIIQSYFDETEFVFEGNKYLGLAGVFISSDYLEDIQQKLEVLRSDLLADQLIGKKEDARIFHFTEDNLEIQPKVIECLRFLHFRTYIAYSKLEDDYASVYLKVLKKILYDRLQSRRDCRFEIFYEENNKIRPSAINMCLEELVDELSLNGIHTIAKMTKENIFGVMPDYLLGVFRQYHNVKRQDYMQRNFEKLRNKIRLIVDMQKGVYYDKHNPYILQTDKEN